MKFSKVCCSLCAFVFLLFLQQIKCSPKKYQPGDGGFQPSHHKYHEYNLPANNNVTKLEAKESKDRLRFGIPITTSSYGNTGNGVSYGNNGMGYVMQPVKIDIGGVALGALIGLGAILIVPKVAHILSASYGYRSLENEMSSINNVLARIDNSLEQQNIDSSSCVQRIICSYVHDAQKNLKNGEAGTMDQLIYTVTNNSLFSYMLDGTTIKQAVELGKQGSFDSCESLYAKCPINRENVMKIIDNLLPA